MEQTFISATILLIVITDPLGNIPLFISNMQKVRKERRLKVILRECGIAFLVLVFFMLFGRQMLALLRISEETLKIAGGIILFLIAVNMIFPGTGVSVGNDRIGDEPFIVPIAIPLISGPSAMVTSMLIAGSNPHRMLEWIAAAAITIAVTFVVFLGSDKIRDVLGVQVISAVEKLMGLLLTAMAIEMLLSGVAAYIQQFGAPLGGGLTRPGP
jgi:MarC family membrane protein